MILYRINCLRGTSTTYEIFETWADGVVEAFDKAKAAGLYPCTLAWFGSHVTRLDRPTPPPNDGETDAN